MKYIYTSDLRTADPSACGRSFAAYYGSADWHWPRDLLHTKSWGCGL